MYVTYSISFKKIINLLSSKKELPSILPHLSLSNILQLEEKGKRSYSVCNSQKIHLIINLKLDDVMFLLYLYAPMVDQHLFYQNDHKQLFAYRLDDADQAF